MFNYRKVCDALLKLRSKYAKLCDGETVIEINGRAGKEKLLFKVENGEASVEASDRTADMVLDHLAVSFYDVQVTCDGNKAKYNSDTISLIS